MAHDIFTEKIGPRKVALYLGIALAGVLIKIAYFSPITRNTRAEHKIEALQLRSELRGNQAAARHKYNGKLIEVYGKAHSVHMAGSTPVLSIGVLFTNVDCHLDPAVTEIASRIRIGLPVSVKGKAHTSGSDVHLSPCVLM